MVNYSEFRGIRLTMSSNNNDKKKYLKQLLNSTLKEKEDCSCEVLDILISRTLARWYLEPEVYRQMVLELQELEEVVRLLRIAIPIKKLLIAGEVLMSDLKEYSLSPDSYQKIAELSYVLNFNQFPLWKKYQAITSLINKPLEECPENPKPLSSKR